MISNIFFFPSIGSGLDFIIILYRLELYPYLAHTIYVGDSCLIFGARQYYPWVAAVVIAFVAGAAVATALP